MYQPGVGRLLATVSYIYPSTAPGGRRRVVRQVPSDMNHESPESRFRRLYQEHYTTLYIYALRRTSEAADAHDVTADTFLVLWRRLDDAPARDEEVPLWLYGVARHVLANRHRTRLRQERLAQRFAGSLRDSDALEDVAIHREDARRLFEALLKLSDGERELLMLAAWEQLSTSDLAGVLGCSENAAAIRLHRARKRLTQAYEKERGLVGDKDEEVLRLRPSERKPSQ